MVIVAADVIRGVSVGGAVVSLVPHVVAVDSGFSLDTEGCRVVLLIFVSSVDVLIVVTAGIAVVLVLVSVSDVVIVVTAGVTVVLVLVSVSVPDVLSVVAVVGIMFVVLV